MADAAVVDQLVTRKVSIKRELFVSRNDLAFVFHLACFVFHMRTWMWHTTEAALVLPGASGFGWFFRYLTFYSYTLQTIQLCLCCLTHMTKDPARKQQLQDFTDRMSCAVFGLANTVTIMFYTVENATKGLVEGGRQERPLWLQFAVHAGNSATAWGDLLLAEQRTFCPSSRRASLVLALAYGGWLLLVRELYGKFPYPVLNKLPFPWGFAAFFAAGIGVILSTFSLGKWVRAKLVDGGARKRHRHHGGRGVKKPKVA